jgi:hypothetical protein
MNYYEARQLQSTGKWHYTCLNGDSAWPVGYCSRFMEAKPMFDSEGNRNTDGYYTSQSSIDAHNAKKDKYHGPEGHDTAQEACDCYVEYQLDSLKHFRTTDKTHESDTKHKCEYPGCNNFETGYASISGSMRNWILCDEHNTRECIAEKFLTKGREFSSFGSC